MQALPWYFYQSQWSILPSLPKGNLLKGQTVIITGANSGIGLAAAYQIAALSATRLILAVRSVESGNKAALAITAQNPSVQVEVWELDLLDFASVKALRNVQKGWTGLMIHCGFAPAPFKPSKDGYERVIQTNVLAPLLTTLLLVPLLDRTAKTTGTKPRILFTGSDKHTWASDEAIRLSVQRGESIMSWFNDSNVYDNTTRYFQSKLLLQMITRTLLPLLAQHILLTNINPGLSFTNAGREIKFESSMPIFPQVKMAFMFVFNARRPSAAARNLTSAVLDLTESQDYWSQCRPHPSESTFMLSATGIKAQRQVWKECLETLEQVAPDCTKVLSEDQ